MPLALTSKCRLKTSSVASAMRDKFMIPALLTTAKTGPSSRSTLVEHRGHRGRIGNIGFHRDPAPPFAEMAATTSSAAVELAA